MRLHTESGTHPHTTSNAIHAARRCSHFLIAGRVYVNHASRRARRGAAKLLPLRLKKASVAVLCAAVLAAAQVGAWHGMAKRTTVPARSPCFLTMGYWAVRTTAVKLVSLLLLLDLAACVYYHFSLAMSVQLPWSVAAVVTEVDSNSLYTGMDDLPDANTPWAMDSTAGNPFAQLRHGSGGKLHLTNRHVDNADHLETPRFLWRGSGGSGIGDPPREVSVFHPCKPAADRKCPTSWREQAWMAFTTQISAGPAQAFFSCLAP